ncbi:hypothetical protein [Caulobacter sp. 1776]|uniref:hypothetical protein n=1 Tax=Caulobacter sp. 1776 TaxID=3156420 RepID=UPI00339619BF
MRFRSRRSGVQFGSFNYPLALVEHQLSSEAIAMAQRLASGETIEGDPIETVYTALSPIHETRHFYDQFGTFAGMSLFSTRMQVLRSFARASRQLARTGETWRTPLSEWIREETCPSEVRAFARIARADAMGSRVLIGNFKPLSVNRRIDDLIIPMDTDLGRTVDAATLRNVVKDSDPPEYYTVLYPFGVEAAFEASAHAITRSFIGDQASAELIEALEQRLHVAMDNEDSLAEATMPYMVLDLLISRFMNDRGRPRFSRDLVLGVADELLSCSALKVEDLGNGLAAAEIFPMGERLLSLLKGGDIDDFTKGVVAASPLAEAAYDAMLAQLEQGGDWDTVFDDSSLDADVRIWESYAAQHFSVPLLRLRRETKHATFRTGNGFLDALNLVVPSARVVSGRISFSPETPERVQRAWWRVAFADEFVRALMDGRPIFCPRAYNSLPGLGNVGFTASGSCETHIALGCGVLGETPQIHSPACTFQKELHRAGFAVAAV